MTEAPLSTIIPPPTVIETFGCVKNVMLLFAVLIDGGSVEGKGGIIKDGIRTMGYTLFYRQH